MANTTNLNLVKPAGTDKALVSVLNANFDKIDAFAGTTNQALSNVNNALSGSDIINNQSDKDLNHYVTTKAWRIGNVSQLTNGPVWTLAGAMGDLYVRANGSYISQLFIGNAGIASRLSADGGSTWNDWAGYAQKSNALTVIDERYVNANSSTTFTLESVSEVGFLYANNGNGAEYAWVVGARNNNELGVSSIVGDSQYITITKSGLSFTVTCTYATRVQFVKGAH